MEEVEILCDRVIIIDKGNIIAEGTIDDLKKLTNIEEKVTVEIEKLKKEKIEEIKKQKHVEDVTYDGKNLLISYRKGTNNLTKLINYLNDNEITYNRIFSERPTLNDVFLELTGKELRD